MYTKQQELKRERHTTVYIIENATLIKIQSNTVGFQGISNQRLENVSHTITHVSIPYYYTKFKQNLYTYVSKKLCFI